MNKKESLESLEEIVKDAIYITDSADELEKEIQTNHWSIGINSVTAQSVDAGDIISFLEKVKKNRTNQLKLSTVNVDLLYYLWFDEQAGHLNFNFINSSHQRLPFRSEVEIVGTEFLIVEEFVNSKFVDGIEWEEFEDIDDSQEGFDKVYQVKVYTEVLKRKITKAQQGI